MNLIDITKEEFIKIDNVRKIIELHNSWKFAKLDLGETTGCFGLAWRSEAIEPTLVVSPDKSTLWIGIEQQIAAICLHTGSLKLKLSLSSYFHQFIFLNSSKIAVLTELAALIFSSDFSIDKKYDLPECLDNVFTQGNNLILQCQDGQSLMIDMRFGSLLQHPHLPARERSPQHNYSSGS